MGATVEQVFPTLDSTIDPSSGSGKRVGDPRQGGDREKVWSGEGRRRVVHVVSDWLAVALLYFMLTIYPFRTSSYERYDV
jgi:hypothetical protein